jgi:hypothetical protein
VQSVVKTQVIQFYSTGQAAKVEKPKERLREKHKYVLNTLDRIL